LTIALEEFTWIIHSSSIHPSIHHPSGGQLTLYDQRLLPTQNATKLPAEQQVGSLFV